MRNITLLIAALLLLSSCARTTVTPLATNRILLSTSAAPACGLSGAQKVVSAMAAVETLRHGYERYVITGAQSQSNVRAIQTGPTYAQTYGSATAVGNTAYGSSTTYYGGQQTFFTGSNDAALGVLMLNPGDEGYEIGIDAKLVLGPDWQEKVKNGISTCVE